MENYTKDVAGYITSCFVLLSLIIKKITTLQVVNNTGGRFFTDCELLILGISWCMYDPFQHRNGLCKYVLPHPNELKSEKITDLYPKCNLKFT